MISFDKILDAAEGAQIRDLRVQAFTPHDIVNLILQRSEVIGDQRRPGQVIQSWIDGDTAPALRIAEAMGEQIVRRAAAIIWLEYQQIKPELDRIAPARVADIGCGYAIIDLFLWHDHRCHLLLIDLEHSENRNFGFKDKGSAYSNLDVARQFLIDNGVDAGLITCLNPARDDLSEQDPVDLATSYISCGFHYPVETYLDYFRTGVAPAGTVIVDLRARKARAGMAVLQTVGTVRDLTQSAAGNGRRVLMQKAR